VSQIDYYSAHAEEYYRATRALDMSSLYERFLGKLPRDAYILDAGCGSGRDTKAFLEMGYTVAAFDGSPQMAQLASAYTGQRCQVLRFQDVDFQQEFDGVWACASILHVPKCEIEDVLSRFVKALKPGGFMFLSVIEGEGERVSTEGRLYNSYLEGSLTELLLSLSFVEEIECWKSDCSSDHRAPWLNVLFKKVN
jgi:2-polyprenyl-3-methyl-5-hydroxy-6-metoxy-1,4-benzoquinol methylase